jgi:S1-C subfamily serine protease
MDSVVVVKNGGTGSGFLIGSNGYILTCAHCVDNDDEGITITYRVAKNGGTKIGTAVAQLVARDDERDLALIKVGKIEELRPVRIGNSKALESGDRITAIGNPALGPTVLDYTLTDGIVSNTKRLLGGLTFVQTTAQINPGSSGGPAFNDHGMVIGLIAAKGRQVDGVGLLVPSQDIVKFLAHTALQGGASLNLRREWLDSTGQRTIDGTLLEVTGESIKLKKADGTEVTVPRSRLSEHDQEFLGWLKK